MPRFAGSTHALHWLYSPEALQSLQQRTQAKIAAQIHQLMPQSPVQIQLNRDEETILQAGLIQTMTKVAVFFNFHPSVIWTAANYLKRFYLLNSLYDPMQMMFTALFLATKAEEVNISLRAICEGVKLCEEKRVRAYEVHLLRGIRYHLQVFSPYRPLEALWRLVQVRIEDRDSVYSQIVKHLEGVLLTDWIFQESPAVLALSGFIAALRSRIDLEELLQSLLAACNIDTNVDQLLALADTIRTETERVAVLTASSEQQFRSAAKKVQGVHKRLARGKAPPEAANSAS